MCVHVGARARARVCVCVCVCVCLRVWYARIHYFVYILFLRFYVGSFVDRVMRSVLTLVGETPCKTTSPYLSFSLSRPVSVFDAVA